MEKVSEFFNLIFQSLASLPFGLLAAIDLCAFGAVFLFAFAASIFSVKVRQSSKHVFLFLTNLFAAVTLAVFLLEYPLSGAIISAVLVWCAGYIMCGALRAIQKTCKKPEGFAQSFSALSVPPRREERAPEGVTVKNTVRLEHALSICDKLLVKQLGRGDRQELEKMKTALTVLRVKDELSPHDGEVLNDSFNALLKLMAKYNL